jgi:hypothetical protein
MVWRIYIKNRGMEWWHEKETRVRSHPDMSRGGETRESNRYRGRCIATSHARVHACDPLDYYAKGAPLGTTYAVRSGVSWLTWLIIAVIVAAFAALTGIRPKDARPVAHTRLMGVARLVFVVIVAILVYAAFRARPGW